jgi:hypothetical protein
MKHNFSIEYSENEFSALATGFFSLVHLGASAAKDWNDFRLENAMHREQERRNQAIRRRAEEQHEETIDFQARKHQSEIALLNEKINNLTEAMVQLNDQLADITSKRK